MKYVSILSRHPSHKGLRRSIKSKKKVVVRLGSTTPRKCHIQINSAIAVENSSDKFLMKKLFLDNSIPTCRTFYLESINSSTEVMDLETNSIAKDIKYPLIAKHRFGSRGTGNYFLKTENAFTAFIARKKNIDQFIFEEFFSGVREYRLHVSELGCFCAWRKLRRSTEAVRWYFNSTNSLFVGVDNPKFNKPTTWKKIEEACIKALQAVGLDIGAIDVRVSKEGEFKIIETNSAPSLGPKGLEAYIQHLNTLINFKNSKL